MRILYLRSAPYEVDLQTYNSQEIGLAFSLVKKGHECDIVYYTKGKNKEQTIRREGKRVRILWRKGYKLLRTGLYPSLLKKKFLSSYDAIICSEYNQIMTPLILKRHNNVYVYNGPYYNMFFVPFFEKIYDLVFCKRINKLAKKVFTKTKSAELFLNSKGIYNTETIGVGLDTYHFKNNTQPQKAVSRLIKKCKKDRTLLYIGSITDRKNVYFLFRVFNQIVEKTDNIKLIVVGNGGKNYEKKCIDVLSEKAKRQVLWERRIPNHQMKYLYTNADIFILPSKFEIFGMVLLEAMYFGDAVVSSSNAGAETLIDSGKNGMIMEDYSEEEWARIIYTLLADKKKLEDFSQKAKNTVKTEFTWDVIGQRILNEIIVA